MTEYSSGLKSTPRYSCDLCGVTPHGASIVSHITGFKHRITHMVSIHLASRVHLVIPVTCVGSHLMVLLLSVTSQDSNIESHTW